MTSRILRLWRYNYTILLGGGYWVIVLPIAACMIVMLWMMSLASDFGQETATTIAELMTPILGAFLVAHAVAPEYRSGIGAVLACKPVSLHRVVTIRILIAAMLPVLLTLVTLTFCSFGLHEVDIAGPLLASLPSLFFLSMLALTAATVFRSALAGFATAAALWAIDVFLGYAANPLLSARGLSAMQERDPLADLWLTGKIVLVVLGAILLLVHARLLPRVCRPPERQDLQKLVLSMLLAVLLYCGSGAATLVGYAYYHRADLPSAGAVWLHRQMGIYGPVPVARVFGPAFVAFVSDPGTSGGGGAKPSRHNMLEQALKRWPSSFWADSIAYSLGVEGIPVDAQRAATDLVYVADRYPTSPLAPRALAEIVRAEPKAIDAQTRLGTARRILRDYSHAAEAERAAAYLTDHDELSLPLAEREQAVQVAMNVAPDYRRPRWMVVKAELLLEEGKAAEAITAARQAKQLASDLRQKAVTDSAHSSIPVRSLGELNDVVHRADLVESSHGLKPAK